MFDLEQFAAVCRVALREKEAHATMREVVTRAVADPGVVLKALGAPKQGEVIKLYQSLELTIHNVIWAPSMTLLPQPVLTENAIRRKCL